MALSDGQCQRQAALSMARQSSVLLIQQPVTALTPQTAQGGGLASHGTSESHSLYLTACDPTDGGTGRLPLPLTHATFPLLPCSSPASRCSLIS